MPTKRLPGTGTQGVQTDKLPLRLQMPLHRKPELAAKLRDFALKKKANNYCQALELLINEADYLERRLQELKQK